MPHPSTVLAVRRLAVPALALALGVVPLAIAVEGPAGAVEVTTAVVGAPAAAVARPATSAPGRGSPFSSVGSTVRSAPRPEPILPDLLPLRAGGLYIQKSDGARHLRFSAGLANIGPGPMEVRPNDAQPCRAGKRHASQIVYRDVDGNGHFKRSVDTSYTKKSAGCMVFHPKHNHWHFEAASKYRLFRPGAENTILVRARKMSFCLRDTKRVPARFGTFHQRLNYEDCGQDTPQGISSGWVDVYRSYLSGQSLALPRRLKNGVYCLNIRVDPLDHLAESDETDNDSVRAFRLHGSKVRSVSHNDVCALG